MAVSSSTCVLLGSGCELLGMAASRGAVAAVGQPGTIITTPNRDLRSRTLRDLMRDLECDHTSRPVRKGGLIGHEDINVDTASDVSDRR